MNKRKTMVKNPVLQKKLETVRPHHKKAAARDAELAEKKEFIYSSTVPVSGPRPEIWDYEITNLDHLRSAARYWMINDFLIRDEIAVTKDKTDIPGIRVFKR